MRFFPALDRCGMVFEASESNDEQSALAAFNGIKSTLSRYKRNSCKLRYGQI